MIRIVCRFKRSIFGVLQENWLLQKTPEILKIFGENVRKERLKQNLSQEEFAERADFHRTYIGMIERAERNITLVNLERIAKALELDIADLLKKPAP